MKRYIKRTRHWIVLLLSTDIVFIFATWLLRPEEVGYMSLFFFLFTVLALVVGFAAEFYKQRKDETVLLAFLETPDDRTQTTLLERFHYNETARRLCQRVFSNQALLNEKNMELSEYQDYIESWVHEVKTPLSLSTLVMNNHKDEMTPYVYAHLNYAQHQINEDVERILFYARLHADHSDIKFMRFRLDECVSEALDEYRPFIEEKSILLTLDFCPLEVMSDRKTVSFMVSQLISNAVKYADGHAGEISMTIRRDGEEIHLGIYNNGDGVPPEDLPFIFDKGFTGNYPNRQKATGMGLYLVRKYAEKLCAKVRLDSDIPYESGFGIELIFVL